MHRRLHTEENDELICMSDELEALGGGGDTRIGEAAVFCCLRPPSDAAQESIACCEDDGSTAVVRDPLCTPDTPVQQTLRR